MTRSEQPERRSDPINRVLRRSRAAMAFESGLRAFWPAGSLLAVVWAAIAFDVSSLLTSWQFAIFLALATAATICLLYLGARRMRWPSADDARSRIDTTLPGRPLTALRDIQSMGVGDSGAEGVWVAHVARMRRLAAAARPVLPDLRLAGRDPWALRLVALVALIAALLFARGEGLRGVPAALAPGETSSVAAGPSHEGWAEPPAYTGRPTLYLPEIRGGQLVGVPTGTTVTLRFYGDPEHVTLVQDVASGPPVSFVEAAPGIALAEFDVTRDGSVTLSEGGAQLGQWRFAVEPDLAPEIALAAPLERAPAGETRLGYSATDDHGVTAARVEIVLDPDRVDRRYGLAVAPAARSPLVLDLPLPMSGSSTEIEETIVEDFSKNPLAGLPVTLTLTAVDGLGQEGQAGPIAEVLPGRAFYDPLAAALIEQRRDLLWSPENARRVTQVLRAITSRPEGIFQNVRAYLVTRVAIRELARESAEDKVPPAEALDRVTEALWQAAVLIEDGDLADAAQRLRRAQERLSEALKNDASDEEVARLMDELRQATRDYMQQMARDAIEQGEQQSAQTDPGQSMTQDQIQELMDRIQELSEQGRKAEAEQLLSMLQQMLENMQMMLGQGSGEGQGSPGQQAMQGLADTLREQQDLADRSFEQLQREFREGSRGQGDNPGEGAEGQADDGGGTPDADALARRQEALRQLMEDMQRGLPGEAGKGAREAMREAERNMGAARDRLSEGDTTGALDRQADVIDQLRDGMRQMAEDMRQAGGEGTGDDAQEGQAEAEGGDDPLGRPRGTRGGIGSGENMLPGGDSAARAREILDEIRRRASEQARPPLELDYLRRLLDQF